MINRSTVFSINESSIKNQKPLKINKFTFATLHLGVTSVKRFLRRLLDGLEIKIHQIFAQIYDARREIIAFGRHVKGIELSGRQAFKVIISKRSSARREHRAAGVGDGNNRP